MKLVPYDWVMAEPQIDGAGKILESTKLTNRDKMIKFNENLRKIKRENSSEPAKKPLQSADEDAKFDFLSPIQKKNADILLRKVKDLAGFELNPETGEVSIDNVRYRGSNAYDLVGDLVSSGKNKDLPLNSQEFFKFLSKSNLPILYIKNTHRKKLIQHMRSTNNAATPISIANTPNVTPPTTPPPAPPTTPTAPPKKPKPLKRLSLKRPREGKLKSDIVNEKRSVRKKDRHPYLKKSIRYSDESE